MARRRSGAKQQAKQRGQIMSQQKGRTEYTETVNKRNVEINRIQDEQAKAKKKGFWEGGWMAIAGTVLAIVAVSLLTGGAGAAAYIAAAGGGWASAGAAATVGIASGLGTAAGMGIADLAYDPLSKSGTSPEEAMAAAGNIDTASLHRGTYGSNYNEVFNPLTTVSKSAKTMADDYSTKKGQSYIFAPLTSAVSTIGSGYVGAHKLGMVADPKINPLWTAGETSFKYGDDAYKTATVMDQYNESYS